MSGAAGARRSIKGDARLDARGVILGALTGACPRCGARALFAGLLNFASSCVQCHLDLAQFNVGDGAAAFVTLIVGGVVVAGAITLQATLAPPIWVQLIVWLPVMAALVVALLRVAKAALLTSEYRTGAREGRLK